MPSNYLLIFFSCNIWSFTHLFVTLQAEPKNKLILDIKKGS